MKFQILCENHSEMKYVFVPVLIMIPFHCVTLRVIMMILHFDVLLYIIIIYKIKIKEDKWL